MKANLRYFICLMLSRSIQLFFFKHFEMTAVPTSTDISSVLNAT